DGAGAHTMRRGAARPATALAARAAACAACGMACADVGRGAAPIAVRAALAASPTMLAKPKKSSLPLVVAVAASLSSSSPGALSFRGSSPSELFASRGLSSGPRTGPSTPLSESADALSLDAPETAAPSGFGTEPADGAFSASDAPDGTDAHVAAPASPGPVGVGFAGATDAARGEGREVLAGAGPFAGTGLVGAVVAPLAGLGPAEYDATGPIPPPPPCGAGRTTPCLEMRLPAARCTTARAAAYTSPTVK